MNRFVYTAYIALQIFLFTQHGFSQTNPNFNVNLVLDAVSAERCIELFEDKLSSTQAIAELRGNRIAASTTSFIAQQMSATAQLQNYFDSLKYRQIIMNDMFHLESARKNIDGIKQLLNEIKKQNFSRRVVATVEQVFPQNANVSVTIPVYVVTLGHDNVDAYVRRIIWHGDEPQFVGENQGELTIVINLAHAVNYGGSVEDRFTSLLSVVAHEVFHAAFGAYKETSPAWKRLYEKHHSPFDELLDLTQNEGIAYYLSLDQLGRGNLPRDWSAKMREAVASFNNNANELLSEKLTPHRASELIRTANLSGYWESYGSMTGMFIARTIDMKSGRASLIETIALGPSDFFSKYVKLTDEDSNLPKLSSSIVNAVSPK